MQPCVFIKREVEGQSGVGTWTSTTRETKRSKCRLGDGQKTKTIGAQTDGKFPNEQYIEVIRSKSL